MNTKSKLAIASFVFGLVSFIQLFGLEKAIVSIIFGTIALKEIFAAQDDLKGKNYAYAGIILGSLYVLLVVVLLIVKGPEMLTLLSRIR